MEAWGDMMRGFLILTGAIALTACGGPDESGTFETEDGTAEYQVDTDSGEAEMRFTDNEGNETVMTSGADVAADLPDGFTIYPGAEVVSNTVISGDQGDGSLVIMTSSDSIDDMISHYRGQAEAAGIDIAMELATDSNSMIGGEGPDGAMFSFNAGASDGETTGMLTVGRTSDN